MQITIEIPDALAEQLRPESGHLVEIIARGLAHIRSDSTILGQEVIRFFARGPRSQEIVSFQPSPASVRRMSELLEKNRAGVLAPEEHGELEEMASLNHLFTRIKAEARLHLKTESEMAP